MSARQELLGLFAQWLRWTEAEAEGIQQAAWSKVHACQAAKDALREPILTARHNLQRETGAASLCLDAGDAEMVRTLDSLLAGETRNSKLLADQRALAESRRDSLHSTCRRLRQIHRAFVPDDGSVWQSYS